MPQIKWNDSFSVNVRAMDDQHVKLIGMINTLDQAMVDGKGKDALGRLFDELIAYTVEHFTAEQELMSKNGYPEYEEHKAKHDAMTKQVLKLQGEFKDSRVSISVKVMNFLNDWLTKHIMETDKKYGVYLNGQGIK